MSDISIRVDGAAELAAQLAQDLAPVIQTISLGVAAEIQNVLAPYPSAPARRPGRPYYQRGVGTVWPSGKVDRTSETMNRRWDLSPYGSVGAQLANLASYSGDVYGTDTESQARVHAGRWPVARETAQRIETDGTVARIAEEALQAALGAQEN